MSENNIENCGIAGVGAGERERGTYDTLRSSSAASASSSSVSNPSRAHSLRANHSGTHAGRIEEKVISSPAEIIMAVASIRAVRRWGGYKESQIQSIKDEM